MTITESVKKALNDIDCSYGNHEWGEYMCDHYGPYHLLHTRKCKYCGKMEASPTPFKQKNSLQVRDIKIYDHEVK
jgi:hypothetical protein